MSLVYIVEDDQMLCAELKRILELQGHEVGVCTDFPNAADQALQLDASLVILDLSLPGTSGLDICRDLRAKSEVPILILTSSESEFDEVMGMRLGADDYLAKPYSPAVLLAHVERLLQRFAPARTSKVSYKGLAIDTSRSQVEFQGRTADLSRNELRILLKLAGAQGGIVSRQDLMFELWQSDEFIDDNTLTVNVNRLRKVLAGVGAPADLLQTHRGQGYSL